MANNQLEGLNIFLMNLKRRMISQTNLMKTQARKSTTIWRKNTLRYATWNVQGITDKDDKLDDNLARKEIYLPLPLVCKVHCVWMAWEQAPSWNKESLLVRKPEHGFHRHVQFCQCFAVSLHVVSPCFRNAANSVLFQWRKENWYHFVCIILDIDFLGVKEEGYILMHFSCGFNL
jgi:hypothetical protein